MNATAQAAGIYRRFSIETASPARCVAMLYEGALRFLDRALQGFDLDDPLARNETIHNNVQRTRAILEELNAWLNLEAGGELAAALRRVYLYCDWRLEQSLLKKEPTGIEDVRTRLAVLHEAWTQAMGGESYADSHRG
ncbi:MAG: flagellar export chaperone FliS [Verrucomicrobiae bacterium]|nr:flagellar export chaperone FliS [Verrucomicrobiae bacterium]MCX7916187.1 flagellar export chaperone FliS [Verrucomicrobiae bacterium]MDW8343446.1 flagellar export chaperone FliS [Verrucomicrobiae bacterium]